VTARRRKRPQQAHTRRLVPLDSEVLNADGAAQILGVSARLVLRLARQGKLPGKKVGKEWRFRRSTLLQWLGKVETPPPDWVQKLLEAGNAELVKPKKPTP
jgi:excisionase family DNA binding protein